MRAGRIVVVVLVALVVGCTLRGEWTPGWSPGGGCLEVSAEEAASCSLGLEVFEHAPVARSGLVQYSGCDELLEDFRQAAIESERERVTAAYCSTLRSLVPRPEYDGDYAADADADADWVDEGEGEGASEYSTTNTQEAGVDEADFVKNDGEYLYMVAGREFLIIEAWPAAEARRIASFPIQGTPRAMYVAEDRAFIYVYERTDSCGARWYEGCAGGASPVRIDVLDISDRTAPELVRQIEVSGSYVSSRRIGRAVHTVVRFAGLAQPNVAFHPADSRFCAYSSVESIRRAYLALYRENVRAIEAMTVADFLPSVQDHRLQPDGTFQTRTDLLESCDRFLAPERTEHRGLLSVLSVDIAEPTDFGLTTIVGDDGLVYASTTSLYVASPRRDPEVGYWETDDWGEHTVIHRFALDSAGRPSSSYLASGTVGGRLLNQFSMGEHEGYLRVATTTGYLPSPDAYNTVAVLGLRGDALEVVGEVTGIAPGEDIRSARFVGDRGFVVTFKKTDPLFVLDLADPERPRVAGELHIPGYSTYIHMMDSSHLLTIGFDAQEEGDFAWFEGVLLQVFDVGDMAAPALDHRTVIGTRGSTSEATGNHLAFNYFRPRDVLAIPMAICEGGHDGSYGNRMTFNGLLVYPVTVADGFGEAGRLSHGLPEAADGYGCSNWWTESNSQVKRSIFMEDYVYSIADTEMIVARLGALDTPVARIELPFVPDNGDDASYR